jgi:hypothetical protein
MLQETTKDDHHGTGIKYGNLRSALLRVYVHKIHSNFREEIDEGEDEAPRGLIFMKRH